VIHRFVDLLEGCPNLGFAFLSGGGGGGATGAVWLAKHGTSNVELTNSRTFGGAFNADPTVSPDNCRVLYSYVPNSGSTNYVTTVPTNNSTAETDIASSNNLTPTTVSLISLMPSWSPTGQHVVFRGIKGAPTNAGPPTIERCDYDGANPVTLVSGTLPSGAGSTSPYRYPFYSDDGTKLLFFQDRGNVLDIFTTDADGTNDVLVAQTVDTGTSIPIWLAGTTTVIYTTSTGTTGSPLTGSQTVRRVEADGSSDTLLYTDPETQSSVGSGAALWSTTPYASLPDGSGVLYLQYFPGDTAGQRYRLGIIDAVSGGWTQISPLRRSSGSAFDTRVPVVRGGRIWWTDGYLDGVVSIAFDGSDYTVEDNTETVFGWFGQ
jgi:Tol biopolymer transport system component